MLRILLLVLSAAIVIVELHPGTAAAAQWRRSVFDSGIPVDEDLGATTIPRGDVFCPLIADPKADGAFASYVKGSSASAFGTDLAAVGVGDNLGILRWNGPTLGEGFQLGVSANIDAQFDLKAPSHDLINADYIVGIPLTFRRGMFSTRVRLYHQSSHLGDEFALRSRIKRRNFQFQSFETILSVDMGPARAYAGGEYLFEKDPDRLMSGLAHGGVEFRQPVPFTPGNFIAALDVKSIETLRWTVAWSARAGLEIEASPEGHHHSRRLSLLGEYYSGPSPYGQFFRDHVSYYGLGFRLGL